MIYKSLIIIAVFLLTHSSTYSLSCWDTPVDEFYKKSQEVFLTKVISKETVSSSEYEKTVSYKLDILENYKWNKESWTYTQSYDIRSQWQDSELEIGEEYILFDNLYFTNCAPGRQVSRINQERYNIFDELWKLSKINNISYSSMERLLIYIKSTKLYRLFFWDKTNPDSSTPPCKTFTRHQCNENFLYCGMSSQTWCTYLNSKEKTNTLNKSNLCTTTGGTIESWKCMCKSDHNTMENAHDTNMEGLFLWDNETWCSRQKDLCEWKGWIYIPLFSYWEIPLNEDISELSCTWKAEKNKNYVYSRKDGTYIYRDDNMAICKMRMYKLNRRTVRCKWLDTVKSYETRSNLYIKK